MCYVRAKEKKKKERIFIIYRNTSVLILLILPSAEQEISLIKIKSFQDMVIQIILQQHENPIIL